MNNVGGHRHNDPPSVAVAIDTSSSTTQPPPYVNAEVRSGRGRDNLAFVAFPLDNKDHHDRRANSSDVEGVAVGYSDDDRGNGNTNVAGSGGGGDGRRNTDEYSYGNLRTAGWPERDIGDYDVIEDDDELHGVENRCMSEARLNCSRFRSALVQQGAVLKHTCERSDFKKALRSCISMDALRQRVPIVAWAPKYSLEDLQGDVIAGVTVGLTLIPQSIAYASIANLSPQYGLYTAFIGPFIYFVLGCSKDIALGPSAIASLMVLSYGKPFFGRDPTVAIYLGLYTGIVHLIMYFIGFGYLLDFISFPVLKAFSVACAITIGMSQVKKWWGLKGVPGEFIPQLVQSVQKIPQARLYDFLLGVVSIFFIVLFKKMKEYKWSTKYEDLPTKWKVLNKAVWLIGTSRNTIVIICTSIVAYIFECNGMLPFSLTGPIPKGIPSWKSPPLFVVDPATNITYSAADIPGRIGLGFIVVPLICLIEGLSIGKACGRKFDYKYDTNQELLSYGIANVLGGYVMAYPATGTYSRTAVNAASGSRTPAGNLITGSLVLIALQFLTPLFYYIPHASLGVVIIMAVLDTITFHKVWIFWKTKRIDLIPWVVTFVLAFVLSIEYGIAIGCVVQLVIMLYDTWRPTVKVYQYESCSDSPDRMDANLESPKVIVVELSSIFVYPSVDFIKDKVITMAKAEMPKGVVMDFKFVADIDTTTVQGVRELLVDLHKKGIRIVTCNLQKRVATIFRRAKPKHFTATSSVDKAVDIIMGRVSGESDAVESVVTSNSSMDQYSADTDCNKFKSSDKLVLAGDGGGCTLQGVVYGNKF